MIPPLETALRLLIAAVLGGIIGLNRGQLAWTAGLRTHMLVAVGSALAIIVSAYGFHDVLGQPNVILDPSRIAAQVISGIGFLGAGTILFMQREQVVRGLTTAAGLWAVASVGLAAGSGLFVAAAFATAIIWIILAVLKPLERRFVSRRAELQPRLLVRIGTTATLASLDQAVRKHRLPLFKMVVRHQEGGENTVSLQFERSVHRDQLVTLTDELRSMDGVKSVSLGADRR
ncbi:MAG: MgtC/SapB family protein [Rhodanobacter sp.]